MPFVVDVADLKTISALSPDALPALRTPRNPEDVEKVFTVPMFVILIRSVGELAPSAVVQNNNLPGRSVVVPVVPSASTEILAKVAADEFVNSMLDIGSPATCAELLHLESTKTPFPVGTVLFPATTARAPEDQLDVPINRRRELSNLAASVP